MLDTLITLLQEESKRIAGKALPTEICRKILIEQGGMQSPIGALINSDFELWGAWCDAFLNLHTKAEWAWSMWQMNRKSHAAAHGYGLSYMWRSDAAPPPDYAFDHRYWMPMWVLEELGYKIEKPKNQRKGIMTLCGFGGHA